MKYRLFPILLILVLLSGCASALVPNEYTVVKEHSEMTVEEESDALTAENYDELRYGILSFIENRISHGVIRAYNYDGDVTKDISAAAYEAWKNDPMGAYSVDFITTDCNLLLSYYEIHVEITYRDAAADAASIQYVRGVAGAERAIQSALTEMADRLILRISVYSDALDCEAIVGDYCAAHPETLLEQPKVSVSVYPDTGSVRIVELDFQYEHTVAELSAMQSEVNTALNAAANYVRYRQEDSEKAELLFSYLIERFDYEEGETSTPVYSLLCEGIASSKTFARVFQVLCDRIGLECVTVSGYLDGESCDWNILNIDGEYHHVDLMRCVRENMHELTYYSDAEMTRYSWDRTAYPTCGETVEPEEPSEEGEPAGQQPEETLPAEPESPEPPADQEEPSGETEEPPAEPAAPEPAP